MTEYRAFFTSGELEVIWAAGFFDGEGHVRTVNITNRVYMRITIHQVDREVLDRFQKAVGLGKVRGPYNQSPNPGNAKQIYQYSIQDQPGVRKVLEQLLPFLSSIKKNQCLETIRQYEEAHRKE